jgi:purine-binding chemotaxis protein CheW
MPISATMVDSRQNFRDFLVFHVCGLDCAFPIESVLEVVPMATLFSPLGLPSVLEGFLELRGIAVPVVRLNRLFDFPDWQPGLHTPIIVLRGVSGPVGVLVNSVRAIVPLLSSRLLAVPGNGTFRNCAIAVAQLDGDPIHLISPGALMEEGENHLLADYRAMAQARLLHFQAQDGTAEAVPCGARE